MRLTLALAALMVLPGIRVASAQQQDDSKQQEPRRLESVTWDSVKHELTWIVSSGEKKAGQTEQDGYKPKGQEKYLINMDDATMTFHNETRRFSTEEAKRVHTLMDLISKYAVESTVWWEEGQGEKVDGADSAGPAKRVMLTIPGCPDRLSHLMLAYSPVPDLYR